MHSFLASEWAQTVLSYLYPMRSRTFLFSALQTFGVLRLGSAAGPYNTFDGPGFPACHNVSQVFRPSSIAQIQTIVKDAIAKGTHVRASGNGHSWYDTMCSDDPNTIIIQTDAVNKVSDLVLNDGVGSVWVEAGATFPQVAEWLHARGASLGYTLVNWNITIAGAIAMGAHRSSLKEDSQVSSAALALEFINGRGEIVVVNQAANNDTWLAATTSLGLLGIITRAKISVLRDFKVYANQTIVDENDVLNGDLVKFISPYVTANFWWWPGLKKFHLRTYNPVPISQPGTAFQNTFSITEFEAGAAKTLINAGQIFSASNFIAETTFFTIWSSPNFHDKNTDNALLFWPVYGFAYDVLIGGLYPDQRPEWEYGLHGKTLELAVPVTQGTRLLKRVRQLIDQAAASGKPVTTTYRSGINIKFGKPFDSFLGQTTQRTSDGADWSKGALMFDFPTPLPTTNGGIRFNEPWYTLLANTLIDEFPVRPHWTKCTREVLTRSKKNLNPDSLARFSAVRKQFDPNGVYKSIVGEILGV